MSHFLTLIFFVLMPVGVFLGRRVETSNEQTVKMVSDFGYPIETHQVETEDGYILTIFRIPHGKNSNTTNTEPILLNHGMMGSAENYIMLGPNEALAYVLADRGYDVWMTNQRGTWHSKKHKSLLPEQKQFWNFSWHELGIYDLPAVIDYILNITNKKSLFFIGHSQGGTTGFVMGSERPEYNKKIKLMIGLSPGAYYKHLKQPMLKMAAVNIKLLERLAETLNIYQLPPPFLSDEDLRDIIKMLCVDNKFLNNTCFTLFALIADVEPSSLNKSTFQFMLPLMPGSIAVRQAIHYGQLIKSGNFQQYDWGAEKNFRKYGTTDPPLYNIKNITYPTAIIYSKGDKLVSDEDSKLLAKDLPNMVGAYEVPLDSFAHFDFITSSNVKNLVYRKIIKLLKSYKNK